MSASMGEQYVLFGSSTVYIITGIDEAGYWVVSVKADIASDESLDGVLITPELLTDGVKTGKLTKI